MRVTLPESQRRRNRGMGGTTCSVVLHLAVLGAAVVTTARSESRPVADDPAEVVRYVPPPGNRTPRPITARPAHAGDGTVTPFLPPVPIVDGPPPIPGIPTTGIDFAAWGKGTPIGSWGGVAGEVPLPPTDAPLRETDVERAVAPRPGNPAPRYPQLLQRAGVEGSVTIRFVVDTLGAVEPPSLTILESTHAMFSAAVREALLRSRYAPAEAGGRRVRQLVEQRFGFQIR